MSTKESKTLWIIAAVIILVLAYFFFGEKLGIRTVDTQLKEIQQQQSSDEIDVIEEDLNATADILDNLEADLNALDEELKQIESEL